MKTPLPAEGQTIEEYQDRVSPMQLASHIMIKGDRTLSVPVHGGRDLGKGLLGKLLKEGGIKK